MKWNERLTAARKAKELSKSELSRRVGVSPAAITQWESGTTAAPGGENLTKLCQVLDVTERYLMYGEESAPVEPNAARSLGIAAETIDELRLLSVFRLANQRERAAINDTVETIRLVIEARLRESKDKRRG